MDNYMGVLRDARKLLDEYGIADANADAWYLLSHVTGMSRAEFLLRANEPFPAELYDKYRELIRMRASHIPLQYITHTQEFMGLEFVVDRNVLIPRLDTEVLVEEVLKVCEGKSVLDLCTGSGCIIISLAKLGAIKSAAASDISEEAIKAAKANALKNDVRIKFIQSNLFDSIKGCYDIIVSNPPYIKTGEIQSLMPEVREHEPVIALDGGEDGLMLIRRIIDGLWGHLNRGGMVFLEIGYDQGEQAAKLLADKGFEDITVKKDLSGLDRVIFAKRPLE